MPYNFAANSFHTKKLCSRLSSSKVRFFTQIGCFAFCRPPLGDLGETYNDYLRLIGKRIVDFLLALIELFLLGVTAEALRAIIMQRGKNETCIRFCPFVSVRVCVLLLGHAQARRTNRREILDVENKQRLMDVWLCGVGVHDASNSTVPHTRSVTNMFMPSTIGVVRLSHMHL